MPSSSETGLSTISFKYYTILLFSFSLHILITLAAPFPLYFPKYTHSRLHTDKVPSIHARNYNITGINTPNNVNSNSTSNVTSGGAKIISVVVTAVETVRHTVTGVQTVTAIVHDGSSVAVTFTSISSSILEGIIVTRRLSSATSNSVEIISSSAVSSTTRRITTSKSRVEESSSEVYTYTPSTVYMTPEPLPTSKSISPPPTSSSQIQTTTTTTNKQPISITQPPPQPTTPPVLLPISTPDTKEMVSSMIIPIVAIPAGETSSLPTYLLTDPNPPPPKPTSVETGFVLSNVVIVPITASATPSDVVDGFAAESMTMLYNATTTVTRVPPTGTFVSTSAAGFGRAGCMKIGYITLTALGAVTLGYLL
ncbi:hypothetical protein TWF694_004500 [Orbilia ellipsospora]|uniref:Uncharacterized protein n=1 Tax=Orbilia ellipsospora TaxID=2528407 RepID=A0AAV9WVH3_9PEZI